MDYSLSFARLFELQKLNSRKTDLALKISQLHARQLNWDRGGDLGKHNRDEHRRSWDADGFIDYKYQLEAEAERLHGEYVEVCNRIDELIEQMDSEIIAAAL